MNLNDPRVIADLARYDAALAAQKASGLPRYKAGKYPGKRGYTIFDAVERTSLGDDIEGVGWHWWPEPRKLPGHIGWYKFLRDAEARAAALNKAEMERKPK